MKAIKELFTGKPFEFYTSASTEEILDLLGQYASTPQKSIEVSLKLSGHSPYHFDLQYFSRQSEPINVRGEIHNAPDGKTLIRSTTHISPKVFIFVFTFWVIWFAPSIANGSHLLGLFGTLISILAIIQDVFAQHRFHRIFCELFEKKKKSA